MKFTNFLVTLTFYNCYIFAENKKCDLLILAESLTKRLQDPANQGVELLEDLQAFIGELYGVYEKVNTRDGDLIKDGIATFDAVNKSQNPLHFKLDVDYRLLKERYLWNYDDRVVHARDLMNETEHLWNMVSDRIHFVRH